LARKVTLALTSDLYDVLLPLFCGTKSDFLDFLGEATPIPKDKTAKLAESLETTVYRNSLRGRDPQVVSVLQLLRGTSSTEPCETVQKDCTNEGTSPDPDRVNYARPLKVTKTERFLKRGSYACALIFKSSSLLAKGKLMSLAKAFYLNRGNITFNGI
jgi:hypothetical protein